MKGTKKFFAFLIFFFFSIAAVFTASCSSPIGGLLVDPNGAGLDYIRAVPTDVLYEQGYLFKPKEEMVVFCSFGGGEEKKIDVDTDDKIEIKIIPLTSTADSVPIEVKKGVELTSVGLNTVDITYMDMKTSYRIKVIAQGRDPDPGGGGSEIKVEWPKPNKL